MERGKTMEQETWEQISDRLARELEEFGPENLETYFREHREDLITEPRPFAAYIRRKLREKGLLQQNVFLAADLSESYGYKLISEEKRTRRRDTVLRLCLGARLSPEELREALTLYGMAPLHARFPRDAALLTAVRSGMYDLQDVNEFLVGLGLTPLEEDYK